MTWRTIVLTKDAKLSLRMNHLVIKSDDVITVPLVEIGQLVIENPNIVMTGHIINALSKHKIMTLICNEKHQPYSHINLVHGHFRQAQHVMKQMNWKNQYKLILWQNIVYHKISNQQNVLLKFYPELQHDTLTKYAKDIQGLDKTNREGHAAKVYFHKLFGKDFIRGSDTPINWGLNYGYSLLLALFTRVITTKGMLTEIGIYHKSQLNAHNLASDFMEVYRPIIDFIVRENISDSFKTKEKQKLLNIFNEKVEIKGRKQYLSNSVEIYVDSLLNFLETGDGDLLFFPNLI